MSEVTGKELNNMDKRTPNIKNTKELAIWLDGYLSGTKVHIINREKYVEVRCDTENDLSEVYCRLRDTTFDFDHIDEDERNIKVFLN